MISEIKNLDSGGIGVYKLFQDSDIVYIGASTNIKSRLLSHIYEE